MVIPPDLANRPLTSSGWTRCRPTPSAPSLRSLRRAGGSAEPAVPEVSARDIGAVSEPPMARSIPRVQTIHSESRIDEYHWLRNREDPEVLAHLEAENRYTDAVMHHTEELQTRLYQELRGRIKETDLSVPDRLDGWLYYSRTETGAQYPIFCRRRDQSEARRKRSCWISTSSPPVMSTSGWGRSRSVPTTGCWPTPWIPAAPSCSPSIVKDLETGELLPETIGRTSPGVAWANDSRTLFYIILDDARRPCRLYRHRMGTNPVEDVLVHFETDDSFFLDINRTRSRQYLILDLASHSTSEVRFASADRPEDEFLVVEPRRHGIEYGVTHHGDRFYIVTNDAAPNFRLVSAPVTDPGRANWSDVRPYRAGDQGRCGRSLPPAPGGVGAGGRPPPPARARSGGGRRSSGRVSRAGLYGAGRMRIPSSTPPSSGSATPRW